MEKTQIFNIIVILSVIALINVQSAEVTAFKNHCATCITANSKYYFSCNQCYDNKTVNWCGWSINNYLECPRNSKCTNAYIGDPEKSNTRSNYYSLDAGQACMIQIYNGMSSGDSMWKIWKPSSDANFTIAPSFNNTNLTALASYNTGDVKTLGQGETHYLYVVNQGNNTINFKL